MPTANFADAWGGEPSRRPVGHHLCSDEDQVLREEYPNYSAAKYRLPHRSLAALKNRAGVLGIVIRRHIWTAREVKRLAHLILSDVSDADLAEAFPHLRLSQIKAKIGHLKLPRRPRRLVAFDEPALVAVRRRATEKGLSLRALDKSARTGSYFQRSTRQLQLAHIARAAAFLGGEIVIRWDE